jgi:hypothetical protein
VTEFISTSTRREKCVRGKRNGHNAYPLQRPDRAERVGEDILQPRQKEECRVAEDEEDEAFVEMPRVSSDDIRIRPCSTGKLGDADHQGRKDVRCRCP